MNDEPKKTKEVSKKPRTKKFLVADHRSFHTSDGVKHRAGEIVELTAQEAKRIPKGFLLHPDHGADEFGEGDED